MSKARFMVVLLMICGLLAALAPAADTKHFREGGGTGYTDVTFDDTAVENYYPDTTFGNDANLTATPDSGDTYTALIAIEDLFTQLPKTSGGQTISVSSAILHLTRYNAGSSSDVVKVYRCTTNWLPGSAGTNENDISWNHADISADTHWAGGSTFSSSDYDSSICETGYWVSNYDELCEINITDVIAKIYDVEVNRGIIIKPTASITFRSSEQGTVTKRPSLEITYTYGGGAPTYTLTVNSGSGDGNYTQSTVVDISADAPATGKQFDKWTGDTANIANVTAASTTLTMPAANQTITATYKDILYTLTVNSGTGSGSYAYQTNVNISANTPPSGKVFDKWTGDTAGIANVYASSTMLTMPAANQTVTATYKDTYTTVKFREGGGSGFVNVTFDDTYIIFSPADNTSHGTEINGIVADTGKCALIAVKDLFTQIPATSGGCNIQISNAKLHLFRSSGSSSTTVSINRLTTNWLPGSAGTNENDVSGQHADKSADVHWAGGNFSSSDYDTSVVTTGAWGSGSNQELIYTVTNQVAGIYSAGVNYGLVVRANAAIAARASENSTTSRRPQLEITYAYTGGGATYTLTVNSGTGDGNYAQSTVVDIVADTAPSGKTFDKWTGDTSGIANVNASSTTLTMPAANQTITATYKNLYTLTVNSGTGDGSYASGTNVNISADAPASGKVFDKWTGDTSGIANVYASSTTLTMPAANQTITATYADAGSGPSISSTSGTWGQGNSITISGSGFGSKSTAAPKVWDDLESGTDGQTIEGKSPVVGPAWGIYTSHGTPPKYSNVANRTNSALCSRHDFVVTSQYNCSLEYWLTTDTAYYSFWWKYDLQGTQFNRNSKPWMEYGTEGYFPLLYNGFGNPDYSDGGLRDSIQDDPMPSGPTEWGGTNLSSIENEWVRFEVWAVQSTPNVSDGILRTWVHRPYAGSPSIVLDLDNSNRMMRTGSSQWTQWHFGSYIARDVDPYGGGGPVDVYTYTDDIYFDVTRARVEVGNASTWAGCTQREIQRPTAWTGSSITITANKGSFSSFSGKYVYVVDSTGVNSNGYACQ